MLFIYYYRKLYLKRKRFWGLDPYSYFFFKAPIVDILEIYENMMYESKTYLGV